MPRSTPLRRSDGLKPPGCSQLLPGIGFRLPPALLDTLHLPR